MNPIYLRHIQEICPDLPIETIVLNPLAVTGLPAAVQRITAGYGFSCALLNTETVNCWGANRDGELGDGTFKSSKTPVQTVNLTNPTVLVSGSEHSCAISEAGQAKCWGVNRVHGQLGDGTTTDRGAPTPVVGLPGKALALAAGYTHTCALLEEGAIYCWGSNSYQLLGNTFQGGSSPTPVATQRFASPPIQMSSRGHHICVLLKMVKSTVGAPIAMVSSAMAAPGGQRRSA